MLQQNIGQKLKNIPGERTHMDAQNVTISKLPEGSVKCQSKKCWCTFLSTPGYTRLEFTAIENPQNECLQMITHRVLVQHEQQVPDTLIKKRR